MQLHCSQHQVCVRSQAGPYQSPNSVLDTSFHIPRWCTAIHRPCNTTELSAVIQNRPTLLPDGDNWLTAAD
jgi:hypothetical protein